MPIPLLAIGSLLMGGIQSIAGRSRLNIARPDYQIPKEYEQNVFSAQNVKEMSMPKSQYQGALQNIARNQNAAIAALQDRRAGLTGIGSIVQRGNDANLNLDARAAQIANQNKMLGTQMEAQARQALAAQKLAKMQWEKFGRYNQQVSEGQALMGAGMQNIFGSIMAAAAMYEKKPKVAPASSISLAPPDMAGVDPRTDASLDINPNRDPNVS